MCLEALLQYCCCQYKGLLKVCRFDIFMSREVGSCGAASVEGLGGLVLSTELVM